MASSNESAGVLRFLFLIGTLALFVISLGVWQGIWAALAGLGLALFLMVVVFDHSG